MIGFRIRCPTTPFDLFVVNLVLSWITTYLSVVNSPYNKFYFTNPNKFTMEQTFLQTPLLGLTRVYCMTILDQFMLKYYDIIYH